MKETLRTFRYIPAMLLLAACLMSLPPISIANAQNAPAAAPTATALSGATIKALQEALSKQGISVTTDGVMNEETRNAIRTYQSQHHLPVTGDADRATLDKLGVATQSGALPGPSTTAGQATSPSSGQTASPQIPMQPSQGSGGMMMSGPMMQEMMQGMMKTMQGMMGMMQGQMPPGQAQSGQMQPGQMQSGRMQRGPMQGQQSGQIVNCPMMPSSDQASVAAIMQMMQGMMRMMEMIQNQMQSGPRP